MLVFTNANGSLYSVLGNCGYVVGVMDTYQVNQQTNMTSVTAGLVSQLTTQSDIQALVGNGYQSALNAAGQIGNLISSVAQGIINRLVFLDNPQPNQTYTQLNVPASIQEVIRQMKVSGATVLQMTVAAVPQAFSSISVGNGVVVASVKRPEDGVFLENAFQETLTATCTADSYSSGTSPGNETFSVTGGASETNPFAFDWPLGSGARQSLTVINGDASNSQGNLLTNSGFGSWTSAGIPSNWNLLVGTAGVNIAQQTTTIYSPGSALQFIGDGTTLTAIEQQFNSSSGTLGNLVPQTQYGINLFARRDGIAPTGILTIDLVDSTGTVIKDANNVLNTFTINLAQLTTNYLAYNGVFRTPVVMPSQLFIRMHLTTPLTNGRSVYFDKMSMGGMVQIYTQGPYESIHAGSVPFAIADSEPCLVTNSRGVGGTLNSFQVLFSRLYFSNSYFTNEYIIPSSLTPTIVDQSYFI